VILIVQAEKITSVYPIIFLVNKELQLDLVNYSSMALLVACHKLL